MCLHPTVHTSKLSYSTRSQISNINTLSTTHITTIHSQANKRSTLNSQQTPSTQCTAVQKPTNSSSPKSQLDSTHNRLSAHNKVSTFHASNKTLKGKTLILHNILHIILIKSQHSNPNTQISTNVQSTRQEHVSTATCKNL